MDGWSESARLIVSCAIYTVAYAVGLAVFAFMARRRGMASSAVVILALAGLAGGAIGAQVTQQLLGGVPGKSILGGIVCGTIAVIFAKRSLGVAQPTGDLFAPAMAAGELVGRFGCLVYGCCYGKPATVAWAISEHGVLRHPTQLYSAAAAAVTLAVLVVLERRHALPDNGLFYVQGVLLCAFRFVIEFYRDVPAPYFGMTTSQVVCLAGFAFFGYRLVRMLARLAPRYGRIAA